MKNKILILALFIFIIYSCKSKQTYISLDNLVLIEYENNNKSKNLYIVDTFYMEEPVVIETIDDYRFVMPKKVYDNYQGNDNYFFKHEDVYLYKHELPFSIPSNLFFKNLKVTPCFAETNDIPIKKTFYHHDNILID